MKKGIQVISAPNELQSERFESMITPQATAVLEIGISIFAILHVAG